MFLKMNIIQRFTVILAAAVIVGCTDSENRSSATGDGGVEGQVKSTTNIVDYADLRDQDILISVDGSGLTKADVERQIALSTALLQFKGSVSEKGLSERARLAMARRVRDTFVSQTLLLQCAELNDVAATSETHEEARNEIGATYARLGMTNAYPAIVAALNDDLRALLEKNIQTAGKIYALIKWVGKTKVTVTEADIDEIIRRTNEMQANSVKVLGEQRAKAQKAYERLIAGESFDTVAGDSELADEDEGSGAWGDFSISEFAKLCPELVGQVSQLKVGGFTKPVECADAIYIVELKEKVGSGEISAVRLEPERLTLRRIVFRLPVMYEPGSREEIREGLRDEKRSDYQKNVLLPALLKKAKILYPSGDVQFKLKTNKTRGK